MKEQAKGEESRGCMRAPSRPEEQEDEEDWGHGEEDQKQVEETKI